MQLRQGRDGRDAHAGLTVEQGLLDDGHLICVLECRQGVERLPSDEHMRITCGLGCGCGIDPALPGRDIGKRLRSQAPVVAIQRLGPGRGQGVLLDVVDR